MTTLGTIEIIDAATIRCHWLPCWPRNMSSPIGTVAMSAVFTMVSGAVHHGRFLELPGDAEEELAQKERPERRERPRTAAAWIRGC